MKRTGPFKNNLAQFRNIADVTQGQLSERLKKRGFSVTGSYISQIEAGLKNIPYGLAIAICEELGYDHSQVTEIFLPEYFTGSEVTVNKKATA